MRRFLSGHLRLRTACDFVMRDGIDVKTPSGFVVPSEAELLASVKADLGQCKPLFADPAVTALETPVKVQKKENQKKEKDV